MKILDQQFPFDRHLLPRHNDLSCCLLIYIPSYGRPKKLDQLLECLRPQISALDGWAKVYVSINPSDLDYSDVIRSHEGESISFHCHDANIGGNANIALGFTCPIASTYLWILSDSDMPTDNSINTIKDCLDFNSSLFCFVENRYGEVCSTFNISYAAFWQESLSWGIGQISNTIYRRSVFRAYYIAAFMYHNSSFPHLAVILSLLKDASSINICFIPENGVIKEIDAKGDYTTDYRLAHVGMPLILSLVSPREAHSFSLQWLQGNWFRFFHTRSFNPAIYSQSLVTLIAHGGFPLAFRMLAYWFIYAVYTQFLGGDQVTYARASRRVKAWSRALLGRIATIHLGAAKH